jgi:hypothetical protein
VNRKRIYRLYREASLVMRVGQRRRIWSMATLADPRFDWCVRSDKVIQLTLLSEAIPLELCSFQEMT